MKSGEYYPDRNRMVQQAADIRSNPPSYLLMMSGYVMVHGLLQDLNLVAALADHLSDV